jgi:hypothetical protein
MQTTKTLPDQLADYIAHAQSLRVSPYTIRLARYHLQNFLDWLEKNHQITTADHLNATALETWQKHLANHRTPQDMRGVRHIH